MTLDALQPEILAAIFLVLLIDVPVAAVGLTARSCLALEEDATLRFFDLGCLVGGRSVSAIVFFLRPNRCPSGPLQVWVRRGEAVVKSLAVEAA